MGRALAAFILVLVLVMPAYGQEDKPAGTIDRLVGAATATRGGITRMVAIGMNVFVGDRISTGGDTRLHLRLASGASIALGDNSSISIEAVEAKDSGQSVLKFFEGVMLAVSAAVTGPPADSMAIKTPVAVLGIRGTEVWAEQQPDHLGVVMLSGASVLVTAPKGAVELAAPLLGTDVYAGKAPTTPKAWGQKRIDGARRSVAFE